jgi:hypothetical protein
MSEIFDEYVKIMTDKGFVKKADLLTQHDKENDSDYAEKIKALYGIDIKLNDSNKEIIEQAHPESVIIAPSYDKLNALVENINERHNVMVGIVNKTPNGNLTQHRYASKDLLDELIRLGFDMDNAGEDSLSKTADECALLLAQEEEKKIKKNASWWTVLKWAPKLITGIAGVSVIASIKTQLLGHITQGVKPDAEKSKQALIKLKESVSAVNYGKINSWIKDINYIMINSSKAEQIIGRNENQDITGISDEESARSKIIGSSEELEFLSEYIQIARAMASKIGGGVAFSSGMLAEIDDMQLENKEVESDLWQSFEYILGGMWGNTKTYAKNSLTALRNSLNVLCKVHDSLVTDGASKAKETQNSWIESLFGSNEEESNEEFVREE